MTARTTFFISRRVDTECDEIHFFSPPRQGSSVVEQGTHKPLVGSSNLPPGIPLLFRVGNVSLEVLLPAPQRSHEANSAVFPHCAYPAFLVNVAPSGKPQHRPGLRVPFCRKQKQLHPIFDKPDLGYAMRLLILENTTTDGLKICEFVRNIVVFQS